jgi:D-sedoheptulose 7-phosphate isomerase
MLFLSTSGSSTDVVGASIVIERDGQAGTAFFGQLAWTIERISARPFEEAAEILFRATLGGRRIYAFGNGGSASTASHLACDLAKTARLPHLPAARVSALADNAACVTAWGNDVDFDSVFSGQLDGLLDPGDVAVAISVSGRSPNVLAALQLARERGAATIFLTGGLPPPLEEPADAVVRVPSSDFGIVESAHLAIVHGFVRALLERAQTVDGGRAHGL